MPPIQKKAEAVAPLLKVGDLVHLVTGGRTLQNYEVLGMDDRFIKLSANPQVAPQTSVILVPWGALEVMGLPNG